MPPAWTTPPASKPSRHAAALAAYALLAAFFLYHGHNFFTQVAGQGSDPFAFIWFLAWWPHALTHHLNPLYTALVWQPVGVHLAWVTSIPLLAILGWPLTAISPVLSFNCFVLLAPILAAFTAYLLCLHITRAPLPSFLGGYLFGFSSYEMGQDTATLNLSFICLVPLALLIVLLRLESRLTRPSFILLAALTLVAQFLISIEIFALIFVFGAIAWALALLYLPTNRPALRRLIPDCLCTAPFVLLPLSPFLLSMAGSAAAINLPAAWPYFFTADLLNFIIPARTNLFGHGFTAISAHFKGGMQEQDAYLGLPLILLIVRFAREQSASAVPRLLLALFLLLTVFTLGPRLWVAGHYTNIPLPWTLFTHFPLLHSALPARFALFTSLCTALIAAIHAAQPTHRRRRLALTMLACITLLPSLHPWKNLQESRFFRPGNVEATLGPTPRVLILPFAINGPSSYWQATANFSFAQTGGYLGFPPKPMQSYPAAMFLFGNVPDPNFAADFTNFCTSTRTQYVILGAATPPGLAAAIAKLHWNGQNQNDVTIYTVPEK